MSCLSGSAACLCAVAGVVRVSHLSVIRQRKKAFCAIANVAYHNRLRARQIGGGGGGWSEGDNLDDISLFVSPRKLFDHDSNLTLYLQFKRVQVYLHQRESVMRRVRILSS